MTGNWYVVQTHPRREGFAAGRIEDLGCEVFLPLLRERKPGRRTSKIGPLFPGYLFANMVEPQGDLARVRWTEGVRRILGDDGRPRAVDDAVVQLIRSRVDRSSGCVKLGRKLRRGEHVRIIDGPLAGLCGILERPASSDEERVCVLLELFQRRTRVELPAQAVLSSRAVG